MENRARAVTLKLSIALCFVLSGVSLFLMPNVAVGYRDMAKVVLPIAVAGGLSGGMPGCQELAIVLEEARPFVQSDRPDSNAAS